jgi:hypothetical protein
VARAEAQQRALKDGSLAKLVRQYGKGTEALKSAMARERLVTVSKSLDGSSHCPECGALVDVLLAPDAIQDKLEAMREVAENFVTAISRTRRAKAAGEF